ncbi:hypothetical protein RVS70_05795 [Virgibacillus sp. M23]|uniref:hypothetical protein n=1 Tax=Virgibacillus sp. M23 TaxID=3079030 RepID=UPI002A90DF3F|nr:hypothetical protein [Virgibacillus sp. M23]MDY7043714.1 hypothetical protein [Virgibacillus sp. M23]
MNLVKDWTTLELVEFLTSYNRVLKKDKNKAQQYRYLYIFAHAELSNRQPLIALIY